MAKTETAPGIDKNDPDALLTLQEVADLLKVSVESVRQYREAGELPYIDLSIPKQSRRPNIRFRRSAVDEFLTKRTKGVDVKPKAPKMSRPKKTYF